MKQRSQKWADQQLAKELKKERNKARKATEQTKDKNERTN